MSAPILEVQACSVSAEKLPESLEIALLARLESGALELPMLPEVAQRAMRMAEDPDANAADLAAIIKGDAALAGHLLKIANSPLYRGRAPIVSPQQAIARLGMRQIATIALSVACNSRIFNVKGWECEVRAIFRHSLAAALFGQEIARMRKLNAEEAFLCGLMHDVGRPVVLQVLVDLERELRVVGPRAAAIAAADSHHASVGAKLAERWQLPPRVIEAVREHHAPSGAAAALTQLADRLAHVLADTAAADDARQCPAIEILNLYADQVDQLLGRCEIIRASLEAFA